MKLSVTVQWKKRSVCQLILSCDTKRKSHDQSRKSRDLSELDAVAHWVICCSFEGTGFPKPPRKGTQWFLVAPRRGHAPQPPETQGGNIGCAPSWLPRCRLNLLQFCSEKEGRKNGCCGSRFPARLDSCLYFPVAGSGYSARQGHYVLLFSSI